MSNIGICVGFCLGNYNAKTLNIFSSFGNFDES